MISDFPIRPTCNHLRNNQGVRLPSGIKYNIFKYLLKHMFNNNEYFLHLKIELKQLNCNICKIFRTT